MIHLFEIVSALFVIDLLTGLYHLATDLGYNFKSQVEQFNDHHNTNTMQGYDWQPLVGAVPTIIVGFYLSCTFIFYIGIFSILAQVPHYFAHHPNKYVYPLQKIGLFISPEHHQKHHNGVFDRNFCIFNGWADPIVNYIASFYYTRK